MSDRSLDNQAAATYFSESQFSGAVLAKPKSKLQIRSRDIEVNRTTKSLSSDQLPNQTIEAGRTNVKSISRNAREVNKTEIFWMLNRWECQVLTEDQKSFRAVIYDQKNMDLTEYVTIPRHEVSTSELGFITPGAVFYWYIGYYDKANGQRIRESIFRFKRGGKIDKTRYEKNLNDVENIWGSLVLEENVESASGEPD